MDRKIDTGNTRTIQKNLMERLERRVEECPEKVRIHKIFEAMPDARLEISDFGWSVSWRKHFVWHEHATVAMQMMYVLFIEEREQADS